MLSFVFNNLITSAKEGLFYPAIELVCLLAW